MNDDYKTILEDVYQVVMERKALMPEGSYTGYLFSKGQDKILKKVGEETAEVIIASKNNKKEEVVYETADLLYHLTVLLAYHDYSWQDVFQELAHRRQNPKCE